MPEKLCDVCQKAMFEVIPFQTSQQEIAKFVRQSSMSEELKQAILNKKWLSPGCYCPHGCKTILYHMRVPLPEMTTEESIAIISTYAEKHLQEFLATHGQNSRIVACVFCKKFIGAKLQGEKCNGLYRRPELHPLSREKAVSAVCINSNIQELKHAWWYSADGKQAQCDYFEYSDSFKPVYREITGWNEYPPEPTR